MNEFGQNLSDSSKLEHEVNNYALYFLYLGLGAFVMGYVQVACWTLTGALAVFAAPFSRRLI